MILKWTLLWLVAVAWCLVWWYGHRSKRFECEHCHENHSHLETAYHQTPCDICHNWQHAGCEHTPMRIAGRL